MIIVCSLKDVPEVCESVEPKYLISVIDPGYAPETPKSVQKHLKLGFDDILKISPDNQIFRLNTDEIPQLPPNESHINSIKKFTESWNAEEDIVIDKLGISQGALELGIKRSCLENSPLPIVMWSYGLITLSQLKIILLWLKNN